MAAPSSSHPSLTLSTLSVFFFLLSLSTAKQVVLPKGTAIHLSIKKNTTSHQYYTTLGIGDRDPATLNVIRNQVDLVIDLGAQITWFDCTNYNSTSYRPIRCGSRKCEAAKGSGCVGCTRSPPRPGCTNNTCGSSAYNPFTNLLYSAGLGEDAVDVTEIYSTGGHQVFSGDTVPDFAFSCGEQALLEGLSFGTQGIIALARSSTSLPAQIAAAFKLSSPGKFALCIPSIKAGYGDIFIGGGSYYILPYTKDLSKSLARTPLVINPVSTAPIYTQGEPSDEYFIDVKFIRVDGIRLGSLNSSLLAIDKQGNGGTKLSTIVSHSALHSNIYRALVNKFVKTAASKRIKRVASVGPFGACFDAKTIASSGTGPVVPIIDLVMKNGVYWRIYGTNSMARVAKNVLCLAFVDGGAKPRTSVVLGGHQLENNLIEFDTAASVLGFSSSLLVYNTSCSHSRIFF